MIKKLLFVILITISSAAISAEKISLVWGFSPASQHASNYRVLLSEVNRIQSKYNFVIDVKPGAGGAIAANHVLKNPNTTLTGASSTFFIRANFDKTTGYNLNQFQPVIVQSIGSPVALYSNKYQTLDNSKKSDSITIGMSGFGSHSNLLSTIFSNTYPNVRDVNYTSLVPANIDAMGQHIDFAWDWLATSESAVNAGKGHIIGITGIKSIKGYKTFSSQGIKGFEKASINRAIFASVDMSPERLIEFHELFKTANQLLQLKVLYEKDYATPVSFSKDQANAWYLDEAKFWTEQSNKVKPLKK